MLDPLILKALLAGIGIAIIAGPIGSLMLWQRMTYFGDTLAHTSLLGVSLAIILGINIYCGLIFTSMFIAMLLTTSNNSRFTNDITLSILSHTILAIGLITATCLKNPKLDLLGYLCGDILAITPVDLYWIAGLNIIVLGTLKILWEKLVLISINKELAIVAGVNEPLIRWIFIMIIAWIFAIAIRLIGVLLINALLIIPCATAKIWAKSPTHMAFLGSLYGCLTIILGILVATYWDVPTGPLIVASAAGIFLVNLSIKNLQRFLT